MSTVYTIQADRANCMAHLFEVSNVSKLIALNSVILLKPNLVEALQPPITTPVEFVADIIACLQRICPASKIIVAEGSGASEYDTWHTFEAMGYLKLRDDFGVQLMDLNTEPLVQLDNPKCRRWPKMYLPKILFDVFLISIPVLKAHSLAGVTLTMKNMMGAAPPAHYQQGGHWKKAAFHDNVDEAVFDLNQYRTPNFTILDASVGMQEAHLWGPTCKPPHNIVAASSDPVAVDAYGTRLLKRNWQDIGHISLANGVLGDAASYELHPIR